MATFEINITADGHTLCVNIKLPLSTSSGSLDELFTQLLKAFDELDSPQSSISRQQFMAALSCSGAGDDRRLLLHRVYTEPDYPTRFAKALRRLSISAPVLH
jgi:hypothetical protein